MAPGVRRDFGVPIFEPEVFRKQMSRIERVLVTLLELFGSPSSNSALGELCPLSPPLRPCTNLCHL